MSYSQRLAKLEEKAEAKRRRSLPIAISWDLSSTVIPPAAAPDSRKPSSLHILLTPSDEGPRPTAEAMAPEPADRIAAPDAGPRCPRGHVQRGQRCGTCIRQARERWPGPPLSTPFVSEMVSEMVPTTLPGRGRGRVRVIGANWNPHNGLRR